MRADPGVCRELPHGPVLDACQRCAAFSSRAPFQRQGLLLGFSREGGKQPIDWVRRLK